MADLNLFKLVLVPVTIAAATWFLYCRWTTQQKLKKLALELGLTCSTSGSDVLGTSGGGSVHPSAAQAIVKQRSVLGAILDLISNWQMSGKMHGVNVRARRVFEPSDGSRNAQKYTCFDAFFDQPKSLGIQFHRRIDEGSPVAKSVMKVMAGLSNPEQFSEIETGNELLDRKMVLQGRDIEAIRQLFCRPLVQEQLCLASEICDSFAIDDTGAHVRRDQRFSDPDQIRDILNVLSETVARLQSVSEQRQ